VSAAVVVSLVRCYSLATWPGTVCGECGGYLAVHKLALPRLDVSVQVGNQLVLFVAQTTTEVRHTGVGLLGVPEITLGGQTQEGRWGDDEREGIHRRAGVVHSKQTAVHAICVCACGGRKGAKGPAE
jgi:hypothetical protein